MVDLMENEADVRIGLNADSPPDETAETSTKGECAECGEGTWYEGSGLAFGGEENMQGEVYIGGDDAILLCQNCFVAKDPEEVPEPFLPIHTTLSIAYGDEDDPDTEGT